MLTMLRRKLSYRVSVEALIELALWLAVPYITIGVIWAFLHPDQVLNLLWPFLVIAPLLC